MCKLQLVIKHFLSDCDFSHFQQQRSIQSCLYGLSIRNVAKNEPSREKRSWRLTSILLSSQQLGVKWRQLCILGSTSWVIQMGVFLSLRSIWEQEAWILSPPSPLLRFWKFNTLPRISMNSWGLILSLYPLLLKLLLSRMLRLLCIILTQISNTVTSLQFLHTCALSPTSKVDFKGFWFEGKWRRGFIVVMYSNCYRWQCFILIISACFALFHGVNTLLLHAPKYDISFMTLGEWIS